MAINEPEWWYKMTHYPHHYARPWKSYEYNELPAMPKGQQTAHTCPVCHGTGQVVGSFYNTYNTVTTTISSCQCRSCGGTGVVWSPV